MAISSKGQEEQEENDHAKANSAVLLTMGLKLSQINASCINLADLIKFKLGSVRREIFIAFCSAWSSKLTSSPLFPKTRKSLKS
jgi:hypothetical protein